MFFLVLVPVLVCALFLAAPCLYAQEAAGEGVDWTYALTSLAVRFVGIIAVLGILQLVMYMSGWVFGRMEADNREESQPEATAAELRPEEAAAISMALFLYRR